VTDALLDRLAAQPDDARWREQLLGLGPAGRAQATQRALGDDARARAAAAFLAGN